ncbi:hypothetical protein CIL05_19995 [Virgibacillus profundi]|uniref:Holin n=1 Tax=Virgibacillus profundi TaxID=2024555 RepID=A0A2A2I9U9_9BACI|nr:hypothetical protein [Virgibacillus profundi]PAV27833.1 hypothetical protein CIL05_19995 [Virgibacillus profundi]PXY51960.1 hypothetical protein CIT14_20360 [Virgibacillus profundi]
MFTVYDAALIPLIVGLVEVLKRSGLPKRLLPIAALLFGVAAGIFYVFPNDLKSGIIAGIVMGLSASGLYSGSKNIVEKEKK